MTVNGAGPVRPYIPVTAFLSVAPGVYPVTVSATLGTVTHSVVVQVTVLPPVQTPPSFSLQWTGPTQIQQGQTITGYARLMGVANASSVHVTASALPSGLVAAISDNGYETYGVVAVSLTAASAAPTGSLSFSLLASDGTSSYTLNQPIAVSVPTTPLAATAILSYSSLGTLTNMLAGIQGGTPPYMYSWSGNWSTIPITSGTTDGTFQGTVLLRLQTPTGAGNTLTVTVTDSSPVPQTAHSTAGVISNPTLSDDDLYASAFRRVLGLEDFGNRLDALGFDSTYIRSLIPQAAGLTPSQYALVKSNAQTYVGNLAPVYSSRKQIVAGMVASGRTPLTANAADIANWSAAVAAGNGLAAAQRAHLQSDLGAAYSAFDSYVRTSIAPQVTFQPLERCIDCLPEGTTPSLLTAGYLDIDTISGMVQADGWAEIVVRGASPTNYDWVAISASLQGQYTPGGVLTAIDNCGDGCASDEGSTQATIPGQSFRIKGRGWGFYTGDVDYASSENWQEQSVTWNPQTTITSVVPGVWPAGATTSVTLCGYNFGTADTVSLSDATISISGVSPGPDQGSCNGQSQVSFSASVPDGTPDETVTLSLSVTSWGNGFQSGVGRSASVPAQVRKPPLSVTISRNQVNLDLNQMNSTGAYLTTLSATTSGSSGGGQYVWRASLPTFTLTPTGDGSRATLTIASPGKATVTVTYTDASGRTASDTRTLMLTDYVTVVAWVDGSDQALPLPQPDAGSTLPGLLSNPATCALTVTGQFLSGMASTNGNLSSNMKLWLSTWLNKQSANAPPASSFVGNQIISQTATFRLYHSLQLFVDFTPGAFSPLFQVARSNRQVGVTPEPCTGLQLFSLPVEGSPRTTLLPRFNIAGSALFAVLEARLGPEGQDVNYYINGDASHTNTSITPWIWATIRFL